MTVDEIASEIVDAAFKVHVALGPGLLESAYEACLAFELRKRGLSVEQQKPQAISYEGLTIDAGYRLDLLVADCVIVELKAVEQLLPVHQAQIITYLKLSGKSLGFLINFHVPVLKQGIRRFANNFKNINPSLP
jgi:GxxExxY protein